MSSLATPKFFNPLSIIFTFFSFTEVMLGYAVSKTTGPIQITLTAFVVAFPTLAAIAFFIFLWFRPEHLYAPKDYLSDDAFLRSLSAAREARPSLALMDARIEKVVVDKLTSNEFVRKVAAPGDEAKVKDILVSAASDISQSIRDQQFFTVSFSRFAPDIEDLTVPADAYRNFNELIAELHGLLRDRVRPYHYGWDWALRDTSTGQVIRTARMIAGQPPGKRGVRDDRTLTEAGIRPGARLEVFKPTS